METNLSRSWQNLHWWDPQCWKSKNLRTVSSVSLEGADPGTIRNGWLTLDNSKARFQQKQLAERELKIASLYEAQQARALDRVRHTPSVTGGHHGSSHGGNQVGGHVVGHRTSNGHGHNASNGTSKTSNGGSPPPPLVPVPPGKVRQMFEERRTKAGYDRSYPLQPLPSSERPAARRHLPNGVGKMAASTGHVTAASGHVTTSSSHARLADKRRVHATSSQRTVKVHQVQTQKIDNIVNGSGDLNHNHEPDLNAVKNEMLHRNGRLVDVEEVDGAGRVEEVDRADHNELLENETFPDALAPMPTPRSPERATPEPRKPPRRSPATKSSPRAALPSPPPVAPPRRSATENAAADNSEKARGAMQRGSKPPASGSTAATAKSRSTAGVSPAAKSRSAAGAPPARVSPAGDGCSVCGRHFAPDRLAKHEEICKKAHSKKRKPFDALKHRLAGTEAEPFIPKLRKTLANPSSTKAVPAKPLNSSWRQKHEEFIAAIRAAKQVKAHLAGGGKLSDLPPPPPSVNPDYVQCPHCKRRFNQSAAERHIPKCSSFQHNKPKPAARKR